jgi:hypothetical protein
VVSRTCQPGVRDGLAAHRSTEGPHDIRRGVGRGVIDDEDLALHAFLVEHALDRPGYAVLLIVGGDDDTDGSHPSGGEAHRDQ